VHQVTSPSQPAAAPNRWSAFNYSPFQLFKTAAFKHYRWPSTVYNEWVSRQSHIWPVLTEIL
jgi:hypothetical protein